jgi:MFS transporter, DHA1 family, inner membrane transport protein
MSNQTINVTNEMPAQGLAGPVAAAAACRLVLNTARRFAYPFAPVLSRGLGVSLTAVTSMIAVNQATGVIGMVFGPVADRFGYRLMMMAGLGLLVIGMFTANFLPFYGVVMVALFLAGLGKTVFDPAVQAYIGERVPYKRRGLVIGFFEFSWAGSTLIGIPLIAILIDRFGWRSPFWFLGGCGLLGIVAIKALIPDDRNRGGLGRNTFGFWRTWRQLIKERSAMGAIGFAFFTNIANDNLFVVYGAWLESSFNLSVVALGIGTSVIGIAELAGEGMTAFLGDRFGLKRSVITGQALCIVSYGLLPLWGHSLSLALVGLFVVFLIFEFTIVTSLSLSTELMPVSRATMMSGFYGSAGIGRVIGALVGGHVWLGGGIAATGLVSAVFTVLGLVSLVWGLWGWRE